MSLIVWPIVRRRLREAGDHWRRRVNRMELMALGGRVKFDKFLEVHAYVEGKADAYDEALEIIEESTLHLDVTPPLDLAVLTLAQQGLDPEAIANRCGVKVEAVAESLARYAQAALEIDDEGGQEPDDPAE